MSGTARCPAFDRGLFNTFTRECRQARCSPTSRESLLGVSIPVAERDLSDIAYLVPGRDDLPMSGRRAP